MGKTLILVGPMGVGKTTFGKRLAKKCELPFTDTDSLISKTHGSISSIFQRFGEAHFRQLEELSLADAIATGGVVATGGGVVMSSVNRELLKAHHTVFLDSNMDFVLRSLNIKRRPLLKDDPANWGRLYDSRLASYQEVATTTINTADRSAKAVLEILEKEIAKL
ncbi:MAG: shikimate kinase [Aquiluna sp.]|nr:shikimate kinase [Aquiluna sp.]